MRGRLVEVGVDYCVAHAGLREEDEHECDFAVDRFYMDGTESPCVFRPLMYRRQRGDD